MTNIARLVFGVIAALVLTVSAEGATVPFTETFDTSSANWGDSASAALSWSATGGAADGFAFGSFNFGGAEAGNDLIVIRSGQSMGSSGGAFFGNYVTDDVTGLSAFVRHDAGVPLTFFVRFAGPMNFPGAVSLIPAQVPSGEWTQIDIPLPNPSLIFEGPFGYGDVFDDIGRVQIGVRVPQALAGVNAGVTFGLDNVSIVPEPTALTMLALGSVALLRRGRRGNR